MREDCIRFRRLDRTLQVTQQWSVITWMSPSRGRSARYETQRGMVLAVGNSVTQP